MKIYETRLVYQLVREDAEPLKCNLPAMVVEYMRGAFDAAPEQEQFWVVALNQKNVPKSRSLITMGTQTASLCHPREVFRAAIVAGAASIICVHQHPSGDPAPSPADVAVTRQLREAGVVVGIAITDHVIVGDVKADPMGRGYYSFREAGML